MKKSVTKTNSKSKNIKSDLFGKSHNESYRIRRWLFFFVVVFLLLAGFYLNRYLGILISISLISLQYINIINLVSIISLALIVFCFKLADTSFDIHFNRRHYFFIIFMSVFAAFFSFLYFRVLYVDKFQHLFFPMMIGSVIYHMVKKLRLPVKYSLTFTFFIVIGISGIFEVIEYFLDFIFDWKLQGVYFLNNESQGGYQLILNKIDDTMIDIGLAIIGMGFYIGSIFLIEKKRK